MSETNAGAPAKEPESDESILSRARFTAIVLAAAMFMVGLDSTVLLTALPSMARDFGVPATMLSSTITIYVLVTATFLPASNWIAQRLGPRWVFIAAIGGFALASIGCGLAPNLPIFLLMRALQAASGSLMVPIGNIVLLKITPKAYLVGVMAISSTPALIAPVIGPPVGGFITTYFEWPWVFFINGPIALIGMAAARRFIPHVEPEAPKPFDFTGFGLTAATLCAIIIGLDRLGAGGSHWQLGGALVALGLALGMIALRHVRAAAHPIVPLSPLKYPCFFAATMGAGIFVRMPFQAAGFALPLMLQIGMGLSAFQAGMLLLAQNAGDLLLKAIASKALRLMGFRTALVSGALMLSASFLACAFLTPDMAFPLLLGIFLVVGMARSTLFTALMALRFADLPQAEIGGATVLGNLSNSVAQACAISGAALLINLLSAGAQPPPLAAFQNVLLILAGMAALAAPAFARLHADAGAEVSGKTARGLREISGED